MQAPNGGKIRTLDITSNGEFELWQKPFNMNIPALLDTYDIAVNDMRVMYTSENIPTKETYDNFYEIAKGCNCKGLCSMESGCSCMEISPNYAYDRNVKTNSVDSVQNNYELIKKDSPVYECNRNCRCFPFCGNRLVQFGPRKGLRIVPEEELCKLNDLRLKDQGKGAGLITTSPIRAGNFICEYAGEVISKNEADIRFKYQEERGLPNYIFCLTERFGENKIQTYIDPSIFGNIGRYINHSCQPNCEVIPVRCQSAIPKLCVFALHDIPEHTEITFDYGDGRLGFTPIDSDFKRKKCNCNAGLCRKFLPFQKYLS